jgi:hypothetical protein
MLRQSGSNAFIGLVTTGEKKPEKGGFLGTITTPGNS